MFGKLITKISSIFFLDIAKFISPYFKNLAKTLKYTDVREDLVTYISNILFISFFVALVLEFLAILLMLRLNIYFSILSFLITVFMSFTFAGIVFLILYRYPYYLVNIQKTELENEIRTSIKHLSALKDKDMTVRDVLLILQKLEYNYILTKDCSKILSTSDLNKNLRGTLEFVCSNTYSELEYDFFKKLIDVLDNKKELPIVVSEFLSSLEQSIKEKNEQRKSKINLLFQINIFLFFLVFILLFSIFFTPFYGENIRDLLLGIAIVFPIIEFLLIIVLNK